MTNKPLLSAISAVALITLTLVQSLGLSGQPLHLSFMPVWLLFMLVGALPLAFVEAVIVRRSRQLPLEGITSITREADIAPMWRGVVAFSMLGLVLLMGQVAHHVSHHMQVLAPQVTFKETLSYLVLLFGVGFAWVGTSRLLAYIGLLVPIALIVNALDMSFNAPLSLLTPEQWRLGASVALMSACSTSGVYAWLLMQQAPHARAASQVLPLWLTQTVVGALALLIGQTQGQPYLAMYVLCAIFAVAVCAESLAAQLQAKAWRKPIALGSVLLAMTLATYAATYVVFESVFKVVVLGGLLGAAVLVGWLLKISHVRKALNFSSEAIYNIWRVAIRLVVPLVIVWLLLGLCL